jgi:putative mRNA 3-end processing factor
MAIGRVSLAAGGAVRLGAGVVCDGFDPSYPVRVQTHVHDDHMHGFESSKGVGQIWCARGTRELLIAMYNPILEYNGNLKGFDTGDDVALAAGGRVRFLDAFHIAGSIQVEVEHPDGYRTGYSGDFAAEAASQPIHVNELVLDATYGSPRSRRRFTQSDAENRLLEEVLARCKEGPVTIYAHRGTLQRAIALLDDATALPMLGSERQLRESEVYQKLGLNQATLMRADSTEGKAIRADGRYILFVGKGDVRQDIRPGEYRITLSAYMAPPDDPYLQINGQHCRIALSNHADFNETLEYVQAVSPDRVGVDGSRSPYAAELALEISTRLGVPATPLYPDTPSVARGWA